MIKFYLVNFKTKFKSTYLVLLGNLEQVKAYSEQYSFSYGSDYYIEKENEQLTNEMRDIQIKNVANY